MNHGNDDGSQKEGKISEHFHSRLVWCVCVCVCVPGVPIALLDAGTGEFESHAALPGQGGTFECNAKTERRHTIVCLRTGQSQNNSNISVLSHFFVVSWRH